jgi:hypothetical protein
LAVLAALEGILMPPSQRVRPGRISLAVAVSLAVHMALALGWLAMRPDGGGSGIEFSTAVDSPDDRELVITLLEPAATMAPPAKATTPPSTLPPSLMNPASSTSTDPVSPAGHSHNPGPASLPAAPGGKPLHGKLKAGKSIVYVIDRSSSMGTDGLLRRACQAVKDSLEQLSPESQFGIVAYNGGAINFSNDPLPATAVHVSDAGKWLDELVAEGASDHRAGLREAVACHPNAIFLLTDADDLEEREVRAIRSMLKRPLYLSVAVFGSERPAGETPLERLTGEFGGQVRYVGR